MRKKKLYVVTGRPHKNLKNLTPQQRKPITVKIEAFSKFDAGLAFMRAHPRFTVVKTEESE
jgi:hypothetical protein